MIKVLIESMIKLLIIILIGRLISVIVKNWKAKKQSQNDSDNREVSDEQTTQREIVYEPLNDSEVIDGELNDHEYVDLGLPSGLKWATCNVGASAPEEYGNYYAWGETKTKSEYNWGTYKWTTATYDAKHERWNLETLTKYNTSSDDGSVDNKTVLELADDAARANWGGAWRMPTDAEWTELRENCTLKRTTLNGVNGYEVKGTNGNSIFLPAAGGYGCYGSDYVGINCYYWSSSLDTGAPHYAWSVDFRSDSVSRSSDGRYIVLSVRPVLYMP